MPSVADHLKCFMFRLAGIPTMLLIVANKKNAFYSGMGSILLSFLFVGHP